MSKKILFYSLFFIFFLIGLYLRFLAVHTSVVDIPIRADASEYYNYVVNMKEWGVYSKDRNAIQSPNPDALRSPGFPWFAYLFYSAEVDILVKNVLIAQTIFQIFSFLFLIVILYKVYGEVVGLTMSWFLWTFPHFVNINIYFLSESLFTSLLACSIGMAILFQHKEKNKITYCVLFSLFLGLAILVRPTLQYFPFLLFFIFFIYYRKISYTSMIVLVVSLSPMILWGLRNLYIVGQWSDPTLMLHGLHHGSFPWFMYNNNAESFGFPYRFDPQANEIYQGVGRTLEIIYERFLEDPINYLSWYLLGKQFFLWQWSIIAGQGDIFIYPTLASPYYGEKFFLFTYYINKFIHILWLWVSFIGLALIIKKMIRKEMLTYSVIFISAIFLYAILIHIVVAPFPRYGIPFKIPAMIIFAIVLSELVNWIKRKFV